MFNFSVHKITYWIPDEFIGAAKLDNEVCIFLRSDGSALGCDGRTYFAITKDDENGDCVVIGYNADVSRPINIPSFIYSDQFFCH
jgi:hypothetical protein